MWKTVKLGDISKAVGGNGFPKKHQGNTEKNIPFFKVSDMNTAGNEIFMLTSNNYVDTKDLKEMKVKLHKAGTIIFPKIGGAISTNKKRMLTRDSAFDNNVMGVVPTDKILPEYLYRVFLNIDLYELSNKAALPSITNGAVDSLEIPLPPLAEQQRIVAKLDAAFAEIDKAIGGCAQNANEARTIFETYISNIFSLGKEKWFNGEIGDICTIKSGHTVSANLEKPAGDYPYLKVADMNLSENVNEVVTSTRFLNESDIRKSNIIEKGSTIFPKRGGAILTNKKRITSVPICADLNIMSVHSNSKIEPKLLYYYFLNIDMRELGSGSSIPQINNYDIYPLNISFPKDFVEQNSIIDIFDSLLERTIQLTSIYKEKVKLLNSLRSSILAQELKGETA